MNYYRNALVEIISMIKDKATYLKDVKPNQDGYSIDAISGMKEAYFHILDDLIEYVKLNDELSLEELGLDDYNPHDIFKY